MPDNLKTTGEAKSPDIAQGKDLPFNEQGPISSLIRKPSTENISAIPVAGGERLGARHWGQSTIIPDRPIVEVSGG